MNATKRWTLAAAVLGSGIVFLDSTVVNIALPRIGRELPGSLVGVLEGQNYVYYAYLLSLSALLVLAGSLSDRLGRRRMFLVGLAGFGITSVACGLAPTMETLILSRILQGAAGAILVPGSLAILTATFRGEEQGRAFGLWAAGSAATTILGPAIGGALVAAISWRAAFLINVPLVAIALWATVRGVLESRDETATGRLDWLGAALAALAVGGLTFGVIRGQSQEWQDPIAFVALGVGAVAAVLLPLHLARATSPLVPLWLFRSRNFSVTNLSTLVIYGALYVTIQYQALFLIGTLGYDEVGYAIATIPGSLFLILFSARFGALAARHGPRWYMSIGPAIMALGLLWYLRIPAASSGWVLAGDGGALGRGDVGAFLASVLPPASYWIDVLPATVVFGIGLTIMVAPLTTALMTSVPVQHSGVASAVNNAISRVGPQLAGALIFVAITASFYATLGSLVPGLDTSSAAVRDRLPPVNRPTAEATPAEVEASRHASTDAFHLAMLVASGLLVTGATVNGIGIRNPGGEPAAGGAVADEAAKGAPIS